jgi:hypothetical protein
MNEELWWLISEVNGTIEEPLKVFRDKELSIRFGHEKQEEYDKYEKMFNLSKIAKLSPIMVVVGGVSNK